MCATQRFRPHFFSRLFSSCACGDGGNAPPVTIGMSGLGRRGVGPYEGDASVALPMGHLTPPPRRPTLCPSGGARRRLAAVVIASLLFALAASAVVAGMHVVLGPRSPSSSSAGGAGEGSAVVRDMLNPVQQEKKVMARAHELDTPETRQAVARFAGIGRFSDRTRRWYLLARDVVLGREEARRTRWPGTDVHVVLFATTWFTSVHKWATGYTECPPLAGSSKGCAIAFYPDYMRSLLPHADVVLYHPCVSALCRRAAVVTTLLLARYALHPSLTPSRSLPLPRPPSPQRGQGLERRAAAHAP
jgi:hypothetical protein